MADVSISSTAEGAPQTERHEDHVHPIGSDIRQRTAAKVRKTAPYEGAVHHAHRWNRIATEGLSKLVIQLVRFFGRQVVNGMPLRVHALVWPHRSGTDPHVPIEVGWNRMFPWQTVESLPPDALERRHVGLRDLARHPRDRIISIVHRIVRAVTPVHLPG